MSDTFESLKDIIVYHMCVDEALITPEASLSDLGFDSLDMMELLLAAEDQFGAVVDDEVLENIKTVKDAVSAIDAGVAAERGAT